MPYSYRISKFDPDSSVANRRDDWTSMSDVGGRFSGRTLTQSTYEDVEAAYLDAVRLVLAEADVATLQVTDVVRSSISTTKTSWIVEGASVDTEQIVEVCRAQLREELACHLAGGSGFSIDVGFDFYLYITSPIPLDRSLAEIRHSGLYVEPEVPSPYLEQ